MPDIPFDHEVRELGDLALLLGGSETSFTGDLLRLIGKAQATPDNFEALRRGFPRHVRAWEIWRNTEPYLTGVEFLELLDVARCRTCRVPAELDSDGLVPAHWVPERGIPAEHLNDPDYRLRCDGSHELPITAATDPTPWRLWQRSASRG